MGHPWDLACSPANVAIYLPPFPKLTRFCCAHPPPGEHNFVVLTPLAEHHFVVPTPLCGHHFVVLTPQPEHNLVVFAPLCGHNFVVLTPCAGTTLWRPL